MMRNSDVLQLCASMRAIILQTYQHHGVESGQRVARRAAFEMGEVLSDMHGRRHAAAALYEVADKITCQLPLEDFRAGAAELVAVAPPAAVPKAFAELSPGGKVGRICARLIDLVCDRFVVGFILGLIMRARP